MGWGGVGWGGGGGGGGQVPSLKGLQALAGFHTLGSRPRPTATPQGCGDNRTSVILGGTRGGGGAKCDTGIMSMKRMERLMGKLEWALRPHGGTAPFLAGAYRTRMW